MTSLVRAARRGLADEAADRIRDAIFTGHFPPGAALREVDLAAALGVSRGSVREGLAVLDREGLITSAWHRGTTVIAITEADVTEVYAVRAALDRLAATTAQTAAGSEALGRLDTLVADLAAAVTAEADGPALLTLDLAFHDAIYAAAGNGRLTASWHAIRSQTQLFQLRRVQLNFDHYRDRVVQEHRDLATLIRSGEPTTLAQAAEDHIHTARRGLLSSMAQWGR